MSLSDANLQSTLEELGQLLETIEDPMRRALFENAREGLRDLAIRRDKGRLTDRVLMTAKTFFLTRPATLSEWATARDQLDRAMQEYERTYGAIRGASTRR